MDDKMDIDNIQSLEAEIVPDVEDVVVEDMENRDLAVEENIPQQKVLHPTLSMSATQNCSALGSVLQGSASPAGTHSNSTLKKTKNFPQRPKLLCAKVKNLQVLKQREYRTINKLRHTLKRERKRKLSLDKLIPVAFPHLTGKGIAMMKMMLRQQGQPYTKEEKELALDMYHTAPHEYYDFRTVPIMNCLPGKSEIEAWLKENGTDPEL